MRGNVPNDRPDQGKKEDTMSDKLALSGGQPADATDALSRAADPHVG